MVLPYSHSHGTSYRAPRLVHRTIKTAVRREVEITECEQVVGRDFLARPAETTKRWKSEVTSESEETFV